MDERAKRLERLRSVLALCEAYPLLPVPPVGEVCVHHADDVAGQAEIEWIAHELWRAGEQPVVVSERGHLQLTAGSYRAFYVSREVMADYNAHMSYADNVRAEAAPTNSAAA